MNPEVVPEMDSPRVSIVMPFLNAGRFIEESIASVFAQSYSNWELLLCDDGSTDASTDIARRYALNHPGKVFALEHAAHVNLGASAARNLGFRHARGDFIALLDADDVWLPHKLQEQVRLLEAHPGVGMLYGDTLCWYSWTGDPRDANRDYRQPLGVPLNTISSPPLVLIRYLRGGAAVACTCSVLARRETVERVGGFEESFPGMFDDQAFYAKMLLAAPVYVADRVWDKYRIHPNSMCAVAQRTRETEIVQLAYLDWLAEYVDARGFAHGPLKRAVWAEKWRTRHPLFARFYHATRIRVGNGIPQFVRRRIGQ